MSWLLLACPENPECDVLKANVKIIDGILDSILEYSIAMGVPCILGEGDMEKVIELQLNDRETALFKQSVSYVRSDLEHLASL